MKQAYFVILGDYDNRHYGHMYERLKGSGTLAQLIDNIFVLSIEDNEKLDNMEKVRNYIAGKEFGYCLVIKINSELSCAWNIPQGKSEILKEETE